MGFIMENVLIPGYIIVYSYFPENQPGSGFF